MISQNWNRKSILKTSDCCADQLTYKKIMNDKENNIEFFRLCVLRIYYYIITTQIISAHLFGSHLFVGATNCLYSGLYGGNQTMTWRHQVGGKRLNIFFLSGIYSGHREKSVHLPINLYPCREVPVCTSLIYLIIKSIKLFDISISKGCWFVCSCYWLSSCTCS